MKNTVLLRGRLAFLNLSVKNVYSDKLQFNLLVPEGTVAIIEEIIKKVADQVQGKGFYNSLGYKKFKSGAELAKNGYANFEGKSYLVLKQDSYGWNLVDKDHRPLEPHKFNTGDLVLVLLTVGAVKHPTHGPLLFLNPKVIQQVESVANNRENAFYRIEGTVFGEEDISDIKNSTSSIDSDSVALNEKLS